MSKITRSARGDVVDFDLLAIKQQLAVAPVPVGVDERRRFIDEKDGIRTRQVQVEEPQAISAFALTDEAIAVSVEAADKSK